MARRFRLRFVFPARLPFRPASVTLSPRCRGLVVHTFLLQSPEPSPKPFDTTGGRPDSARGWPRTLAVTDYSIFSDRVRVSRLRGEATKTRLTSIFPRAFPLTAFLGMVTSKPPSATSSGLRTFQNGANVPRFFVGAKADRITRCIEVIESDRLDIQVIFGFVGDFYATFEGWRLDDLFGGRIYSGDDLKVAQRPSL